MFDCELLGTIIVIEGNDYDYIVPETKAWNHMCYMNKNYITIILSNPVNYSTDSVQMIKGNYLPLEEFLDEEEKDSFYIEELVEIQNRINKTEKTLTRKIS